MTITDLTKIEAQLLEGVALGKTGPEQAKEWNRSVTTIYEHRRHIRQKLGARTMAQAVQLAAELRVEQAKLGTAPLTEGQLRAFHAKAGELDRSKDRQRGESKQLALLAVGMEFGGEFTSANDLDQRQASWALDYLEMQL